VGRVSGKAAIVTGAASGMGAATARVLAREGARVLLTDVQAELGEEVARSIREAGGDGLFMAHDVVSEQAWDAVTARALDAFGGLQILVNNAALAFPNGDVERQTLAEWRTVMAVNLDGVFLGVQAGVRTIKASGTGGSIINFSSILGFTGSPTTAAYTASKGGVRLLTKSAALHCAKSGYGIRVNSIHPGYIRTPMVEETFAKLGDPAAQRARVEALTPLGHLGEPDDVAYGVLYLASDESKFVTGTELVIDGGYLAQ
jgi:3(or 17)beta-hydroxysteroid dehydrogenase